MKQKKVFNNVSNVSKNGKPIILPLQRINCACPKTKKI